jgi:hypothetical protein
MAFKTLFGLTVIPAALIGGSLIALLSYRIRDLFFVLIVFLSPLVERFDVNFVSREWYRGTARGFEVSVIDIMTFSLLVACFLRPREGEKRGFWPGSMIPMLMLFFYAIFNVLINEPQLFGYFELFKMFRTFVLVLAVAFYVRSEREMRLFMFTMAALVCFEGVMALKQRYFEGIHRVPGMVDDSNSLSMLLCLTSPLLVAAINSRMPVITKLLCGAGLALSAVAEVLTISRAGVVTLALVLLGTALTTMSFKITVKKIAICLVVILGAGGIAAKSWKTLKERFESSTLDQEYGNHHNLGRGYYIRVAKATAAEHPLGIGLNNWSYRTSNEYGPKLGYKFVPYSGTEREPSTVVPPDSNIDEAQAAPAHCLAALTLGELGYVGLALLALCWVRWFQMSVVFLWRRTPDPMKRMGVGIFFGFCGIFLQSLTEWVFRQLPIYYVFHIMVGVLASMYYTRNAPEHDSEHEAAYEEDEDDWAIEQNPLEVG